VSLVLALLGIDELALIFGAGIAVGIARWTALVREGARRSVTSLILMILIPLALFIIPAAFSSHIPGASPGSDTELVPFQHSTLFLFFLKVGSVLYGSGYVLLAFLRAGLVDNWRWLTETQLLDAAIVGQVTPGPVFTTATFIGYLLGGPLSALLATIAIFLPSFVFVALSGPLVPRIRSSPLAGAFLDGVNASSLALMVAVTTQLAQSALLDPLTTTLALASAIHLVRFKVNSAWLIFGAAFVGLLTSWLHP
jgi:chromate transporter